MAQITPRYLYMMPRVSFSEGDRTECQESVALWSGASDWLAFKAA